MRDDLSLLVAKDGIAEVIHTLFIATDRRDWAAVRSCFGDAVLFDMTSLTGGAPATVTPAQIAAAWEAGLAPIRAVHHQAGNLLIQVDGSSAKAFCYATATHYKPNPTGRDTRTFVGGYEFELSLEDGRWRIGLFRFNLKYLDGNLELETS